MTWWIINLTCVDCVLQYHTLKWLDVFSKSKGRFVFKVHNCFGSHSVYSHGIHSSAHRGNISKLFSFCGDRPPAGPQYSLYKLFFTVVLFWKQIKIKCNVQLLSILSKWTSYLWERCVYKNPCFSCLHLQSYSVQAVKMLFSGTA